MGPKAHQSTNASYRAAAVAHVYDFEPLELRDHRYIDIRQPNGPSQSPLCGPPWSAAALRPRSDPPLEGPELAISWEGDPPLRGSAVPISCQGGPSPYTPQCFLRSRNRRVPGATKAK